MDFDEKSCQTLNKLGLTILQAKVYLTLIQSGREKIGILSKNSGIDRSNTYQTIIQLQNKGLVEKILGAPNLYQALPIEDGISVLLKHKQDQYNEIQKEAQELASLIRAKDMTSEKKEYEFKIVKRKKETGLKEIINGCKFAQECFDELISTKTFYEGFVDLYKEQLGCVKRGIKYRMITEKISTKLIQNKLNTLMAEPNFQLRYILKAPEIEVGIQDKKFAQVTLSPNSFLGESPCLYTTHPGCIEMFENYFEMIWKQAKEYKNLKTIKQSPKNREQSALQLTSPETSFNRHAYLPVLCG